MVDYNPFQEQWLRADARCRQRETIIREWFREERGIADRKEHTAGVLLLSWERQMPVDERWQTVLDMVRLAPDDRCLGAIGAGPLESLLGYHGDEVIDRVEAEASRDPKFHEALCGVWQFRMSDEVWGRVQAVRGK